MGLGAAGPGPKDIGPAGLGLLGPILDGLARCSKPNITHNYDTETPEL